MCSAVCFKSGHWLLFHYLFLLPGKRHLLEHQRVLNIKQELSGTTSRLFSESAFFLLYLLVCIVEIPHIGGNIEYLPYSV